MGLNLSSPESRRFTPHVSLARLKPPLGPKVPAFIAGNALFRAEPFEVSEFNLVASYLTKSGAIYSFLLTEKAVAPDLKVYVEGTTTGANGKPKYYSAAEVEALETLLAGARAALKHARKSPASRLAGA